MIDKELLPEPEDTIGFTSYRASLSIKQYLNKQFKDNGFDITIEQYGVMYRIFKQDGISQNQIAEKVFKQGPNVTRIIDDLEEKGWVMRKQDPSDRRRYSLALTEAGNKFFGDVISVLVQSIFTLKEGISEEEMSTTIKVLNKIYNNLSSKEDLICT